jgi:hypothetical protein
MSTAAQNDDDGQDTELKPTPSLSIAVGALQELPL